MNGGDAADELVRIMLNGSEVAIRLTGSAAKNLAALLIAWSKKEKKVYGKTNMMRLLKDGDELRVLPMTRDQYRQFKHMAKKTVLYSPFTDRKSTDGKLDVVIKAKSIPMVNHILKRIGYGEVEKPAEEAPEIKKKDTPSRQSSKDVKGKSEASRVQDAPSPRSRNKPSVKERLEGFRQQLDREKPIPVPTRTKTKGKVK